MSNTHEHVSKNAEATEISQVEEIVNRVGLWKINLPHRESATVVVKIVDVRPLWDRVDLLIETNSGSRVWVSDKTVKLLEQRPIRTG